MVLESSRPEGLLLCPRPELSILFMPRLTVGRRCYRPDAVLRLLDGGVYRLVAVMLEESGRALPCRPPLPFLRLRAAQLEHVVALIERVRELLDLPLVG